MSGKLKAYEAQRAAEREALERLHDEMFMPKELKEARRKRDIRFAEVAKEQKERRHRFTSNQDIHRQRDAYRFAPQRNNGYAIEASRVARKGRLPAPTEVRRFDDGSYEYIWAFQGPHGIGAIENILTHAKGEFPLDAAGYISQGTGYGKEAEWGGTAFSRVHATEVNEKTLWWQLQTFKSSTTDSLKHLREFFGVKQENGRFPTQWVELKILSSEGMKYENKFEDGSAGDARGVDEGNVPARSERVPRKRKRSGVSASGGKGRNATRKKTKRRPRS